MEFFICNLVRVVKSPRFYMSLFLTLLCMSLGNFLAFNGIYKIEGLSIFFAASSIRGFSPISLVAAPVSYTHLDVYKRQVLNRSDFSCIYSNIYR